MEYEQTHPWIRFQTDLSSGSARFWMLVGEARSKCQHIQGVPLEPDTADALHRLYLAKGVLATTAIEGNTLSEEQVLQHLEGRLQLPPGQEYLKQEIDNILEACNQIWSDLQGGGSQTLSPEMVKDFNRRVLKDLELEEGVVPGELIQSGSNVVGGIYKGAPASDCEYLLKELCTWLEGPMFDAPTPEMKIPLAIIKAILAHLYLVWIHPFGDGNGRTSRLMEVQIISAAGIPKPAAHLLSNHYNQTRPEYYRQLSNSSKADNGDLSFIDYALAGFVEGLKGQLERIREQQWRVAWETHVHRAFQDDDTPTGQRRRKLVLALSRHGDAVPKSQLPALSSELALAYRQRDARALTRDLKLLVERELVLEDPRGYRAAVETILAFLPSRVEESSP